MYPRTENEKEEVSCCEEEEDDKDFNEDMEALRRACMLTGRDPDDIDKEEEDDDDEGFNEDLEALRRACMLTGRDPSDIDKDDDTDEDLELLNKIKSQFSDSLTCKPLSLSTLPPATVCNDYQTLLAIRKRFAAYDKDTRDKSAEQIDLSCFNEEISTTDTEEGQPSTSENSGLFPKSALTFLDAINKNRACQKFLQSKQIHIQAKIEENKKIKQRVKILRDFQLHCKRRTGEALSQKKDPRVQLILTKRPREDSIKPPHDDEDGAMSYGQEENSHVANYRMMALKKVRDRKNWSEVEKKDLQKGIRQQFQEMVLQSSYSEIQDSNNDDIDKILCSIKDVEITPYSLREFLPKVNWQQLAAMYVPSRSGEECKARWLNWEDPLINHEPWTVDEDKNILELVQEKGVNDWIDIAAALLVRKGTNRTPFQCLARYQRSLNASILKHEWTKDDDAKLGSAVEAFGEGDWQSVASSLEGRTGTQCSNRWKKALHPRRTRKGKWTREEDTLLTVAQMLFGGSKNWNKISQFVPGRTQAQCRDRFVNSLEPSLKFGEWTEEEDSMLRAAIAGHGHCWSKFLAVYLSGLIICAGGDGRCCFHSKCSFSNKRKEYVTVLLSATLSIGRKNVHPLALMIFFYQTILQLILGRREEGHNMERKRMSFQIAKFQRGIKTMVKFVLIMRKYIILMRLRRVMGMMPRKRRRKILNNITEGTTVLKQHKYLRLLHLLLRSMMHTKNP
ncbi:hypothetical protein M0R45_026658 [Rubus argutus]|uniref:Uncharacterized protein n=1 Tax=Rubus argutus TaxID=59490 RepID=A0AAW1X0N1_RUBAR